jgi:hypothetical protein
MKRLMRGITALIFSTFLLIGGTVYFAVQSSFYILIGILVVAYVLYVYGLIMIWRDSVGGK